MTAPIRWLGARLGASYLCAFSAVGLWSPFAAPWLAARGLSATSIGLLLGLGTGMKLLAPTLWAWFADATGAHARLIRWTIGAAFVCTLWFWLAAPSVAVLAGAIAAYAFFWNASGPQLEAVTLGHLGTARYRYGSIRLWGSLGFLGSVVGAGALFERVGFSAFPVVLSAALGAAWLASLALPDASPVAPSAATPSLPGALRAPGVVLLFTVLFLMQLGFGPYYGFFSLYLGTLGWAPGAVGLFWAGGVLAEIVAFAVLPRLPAVRLLGMLELACALTALRWLMTALWADRIAVLGLAQSLHFASFALYHAAAVQLVLRAFPGRLAARGQALHSTVAYGAGGALGVAVGGILWDRIGPAGPFLFGAAVSAVAWICAARLARHPDAHDWSI